MNIVLLTSHSIAEYDDLRMLTDLGYNVFSIGAYTDPSSPSDDKRPALPEVPYYADLAERCQRTRAAHLDPPGDRIDWAKADLHDDIIDWADVIIVHHFPERWIRDQWSRIAHKRVIWRTCGQSDPRLEVTMAPLHRQGLEIVRYSPKEREYFDSLLTFAGEDAVIRFGKYPGDFAPWIGDEIVVGNITQHMAQRGDACGYGFWAAATEGLPTRPAGPGSEAIGGLGTLTYDEMLDYLRHLRVYLYTGTRPASYTLGLMEAMFAGVPTVTMPKSLFWPSELFEGEEIVQYHSGTGFDLAPGQHAYNTRTMLMDFLRFDGRGSYASEFARNRAIELFDVATVGPQWVAFLGQP